MAYYLAAYKPLKFNLNCKPVFLSYCERYKFNPNVKSYIVTTEKLCMEKQKHSLLKMVPATMVTKPLKTISEYFTLFNSFSDRNIYFRILMKPVIITFLLLPCNKN